MHAVAAPSANREAILQAAERVFARHGYDGATFSHICEAAGVSRGLPAYLFGNKEGLYREVLARSAAHLRSAVIEPLQARAETLTTQEACAQIAETYIDFLAARPLIVRILQWELLADPADERPFAPASALFGELHALLAAIAKREHARIDTRAALQSTIGLCFFPFVLGTRVGVLGDTNAANRSSVDRLKRHVHRLLAGGLECLSV
jgi:TetR/AcrR family transcriptional regulator